jgi:enamine deaminase RidA (YjgF/YER057c/UK114 family)
MTTQSDRAAAEGAVQYLNPAGLPKNPAFTQAVVVTGAVTAVYVGAQNAVDASGAIVGKGDIAVQTEQVLKNVQACLEAGGATPDHLIRWSIYIVHGQPLEPAFAVFQRWWGTRPNPPLNSVMFVSGFPHPDFLLAIDALAMVPQTR